MSEPLTEASLAATDPSSAGALPCSALAERLPGELPDAKWRAELRESAATQSEALTASSTQSTRLVLNYASASDIHADAYFAAGFSPHTAAAFLVCGIIAAEAELWVRVGVERAAEARRFISHKMTPLDCHGFRQLGFVSPDEPGSLEAYRAGMARSELIEWESRGISVREAVAWRAAGMAPVEAAEWLRVGASTKVALEWTAEELTPVDHREWYQTVRDAVAVKLHKSVGAKPGNWQQVARRELRIRLIAGGIPPDIATTLETSGVPVEDLIERHRFGLLASFDAWRSAVNTDNIQAIAVWEATGYSSGDVHAMRAAGMELADVVAAREMGLPADSAVAGFRRAHGLSPATGESEAPRRRRFLWM